MVIEFNPEFIPDDDGAMDYPVLPRGDYDAVIANATEKQSKAGNDMIELVLEIEHDGRTHKVWDHLTFTEKAMGVVKNTCDALGLGDRLRTGQIAEADFLGCMCRVRIKHEQSEQYGTRERVAFYHAAKKGDGAKTAVPAIKREAADIDPNDIPF